jgi:hypothetical protein
LKSAAIDGAAPFAQTIAKTPVPFLRSLAGNKKSLWRQTAVVLPLSSNVNLFLPSAAAKNSKGKTTEVAEFADASFCSSNGAGK